MSSLPPLITVFHEDAYRVVRERPHPPLTYNEEGRANWYGQYVGPIPHVGEHLHFELGHFGTVMPKHVVVTRVDYRISFLDGLYLDGNDGNTPSVDVHVFVREAQYQEIVAAITSCLAQPMLYINSLINTFALLDTYGVDFRRHLGIERGESVSIGGDPVSMDHGIRNTLRRLLELPELRDVP
jgi:hypothetical protein